MQRNVLDIFFGFPSSSVRFFDHIPVKFAFYRQFYHLIISPDCKVTDSRFGRERRRAISRMRARLSAGRRRLRSSRQLPANIAMDFVFLLQLFLSLNVASHLAHPPTCPSYQPIAVWNPFCLRKTRRNSILIIHQPQSSLHSMRFARIDSTGTTLNQ